MQLSFNFDDNDLFSEIEEELQIDPDIIKEQLLAKEKSEEEPLSPTTEPASEPIIEEITEDILKPQDMKRAILGWLLTQKPSGIGLKVPTRVSKYCADVAAFWSSPGKKHLMQPQKTFIVEIRKNREHCWPDCSKQEELLPLLLEQKKIKVEIESEIRATEPELKDSDTLFTEYESWQYSRSQNKSYKRCLKQLEEVEHALYKGSRFERIRRASVADNLYLAVPEGTLAPSEVADAWGLLYIKPDLSVEVIKEAEDWNCTIENRLHLAQNIAASSRDALYFSLGVGKNKNAEPIFTRIPKRRRK